MVRSRGPLLCVAALCARAGVARAQPPPQTAARSRTSRSSAGWTGSRCATRCGACPTRIGVKCDHCHVQGNFASDEKRAKHTGRRMLELTLALNTRALPVAPPAEGESRLGRITCYTCHQGAATPKTSTGFGLLPMTTIGAARSPLCGCWPARWQSGSASAAAQAPEPTKPGIAESPTITVLKGLMVPQFEVEMRHFVQALGVNCGGCHVPRQLPSDDNPRKADRPPDDRDDPWAEREVLSQLHAGRGRILARAGHLLHLSPGVDAAVAKGPAATAPLDAARGAPLLARGQVGGERGDLLGAQPRAVDRHHRIAVLVVRIGDDPADGRAVAPRADVRQVRAGRRRRRRRWCGRRRTACPASGARGGGRRHGRRRAAGAQCAAGRRAPPAPGRRRAPARTPARPGRAPGAIATGSAMWNSSQSSSRLMRVSLHRRARPAVDVTPAAGRLLALGQQIPGNRLRAPAVRDRTASARRAGPAQVSVGDRQADQRQRDREDAATRRPRMAAARRGRGTAARTSPPTTSPGTTCVATSSSGPGKYLSSWNSDRKYHSGRGT